MMVQYGILNHAFIYSSGYKIIAKGEIRQGRKLKDVPHKTSIFYRETFLISPLIEYPYRKSPIQLPMPNSKIFCILYFLFCIIFFIQI